MDKDLSLCPWSSSFRDLDNFQPCRVRTMGPQLPQQPSPSTELPWEHGSLTSLQTPHLKTGRETHSAQGQWARVEAQRGSHLSSGEGRGNGK